uniref:Uncharacterized protein n=1 Tax=Parascaris equorum TaxID=6256 RepID=A0A914RIU9_PAREQ
MRSTSDALALTAHSSSSCMRSRNLSFSSDNVFIPKLVYSSLVLLELENEFYAL